MLLDTFSSFTFEKTNFSVVNSTNDPIFYPNGSDSDWVVVSITQEQLRSDFIIPYIMSFLTSDFHNGRVNHVYYGKYIDSTDRESPNEATNNTHNAYNK